MNQSIKEYICIYKNGIEYLMTDPCGKIKLADICIETAISEVL